MSMPKIIPAIIPKSLTDLDEMLARVAPFTHEVQIDIVDGVLVPFTSWPYAEHASSLDIANSIQGFEVELDLMVSEPENVLEDYLKAGVTRVVIHLEGTRELERIIALKDMYDFQLGFSIRNDTDIEVLTSVIHHAAFVQCMGIAEIGVQGNAFDERVLTRIQDLKKMYPALPISVDGSVNTETIARLYAVGAERFISGSAIFSHAHPHEAYAALGALCKK